MDAFISTIVTLIQLALAGFVAWGAWLAFKSELPRKQPAPQPREERADDFERVASLVLLALLCTTLMAAA
jgi:hypothetical protein